MAYVTTPKVKGRWKSIPVAINYPRYLWEGRHDVALGQFNGFVTKFAPRLLVGKADELVTASD